MNNPELLPHRQSSCDPQDSTATAHRIPKLQHQDIPNMDNNSYHDREHSNFSHEIQTLLKNNNDPSESAVSEIHEFLRGSREELESLNASIQDLERRLETLKTQRSKVQDTITRYSTILSPIRRVPADILSEIFFHCLPTHRYPFLISRDAPVLLTRICSNWRNIAHSTPRLWARIHIAFTDSDRISDEIDLDIRGYKSSHPGVYTVQEATDILRLRCNAVEQWLARSGTCPLYISLHYTSWMHQWESLLLSSDPEETDSTDQLFRILSNVSHRWHALDLRIPLGVFREKLRKILVAADLRMLTSLKILLTGDNFGGNTPLDYLPITNLKRFTMSGASGDTAWRTFDLNITQTWTNLTDFFSYVPLCLDEIITVFKNCPNVIRSVLVIKSKAESSLQLHPAPEYQVQLSLPNLRDLCIVDYMDPIHLGNFYGCIDAPNLKWVDYTVRTAAYNYGLSAYDNGAKSPPITALLRKAAKLKRLVLNAVNLTATNMFHIFENASNVTHLVIGPDLRTSTNTLFRESPNISRRYNWKLVDLGIMDDVEEPSVRSENSNKSPTTALLPRLEVLEISDGMQIHMPDEILLRFILSRMDPSSPHSLAVLKKVHIHFNRLKEKDIVGDIFRQAKLVGLHIDLNLDYIKEDDKGLEAQYEALHINPGYGFPFDDSSANFWDHDVMDDEVV